MFAGGELSCPAACREGVVSKDNRPFGQVVYGEKAQVNVVLVFLKH